MGIAASRIGSSVAASGWGAMVAAVRQPAIRIARSAWRRAVLWTEERVTELVPARRRGDGAGRPCRDPPVSAGSRAYEGLMRPSKRRGGLWIYPGGAGRVPAGGKASTL